MQDNKIEGDSDELIRMLVLMPSLACLYLQGNPIVGSLRHYRKRVISQVATLTYLDDRPISALERTCAEAWASGGVRSEHNVRNSHKAAEEVKMRRNQEFMGNLRKEANMKRMELALRGRVALRRAAIDYAGSSFSLTVKTEPRELANARFTLSQLCLAS